MGCNCDGFRWHSGITLRDLTPSIQVTYPEGIDAREVEELLQKSLALHPAIEHPNQNAFYDPVITEIAEKLVTAHSEMYDELLLEIKHNLESEYGHE